MNAPAQPTLPAHPVKRLLRDMEADVLAYTTLHALLEEQFTAALAHDSQRLEALARDVTTLVEALEQRRQTRVALVRQMLPGEARPGIDTLLALLPPNSKAMVAASWERLEALVRGCKESNRRNGRLMTDQQAIFQRVLRGDEEDNTYAAL
jgi:flagella synthesis protein FlgN